MSDKQDAINKTNQKLKELGIDKTLDECYDDYCAGNEGMKSYKIIKKYNEDNGGVIGHANPYNIYNKYLYSDRPTTAELIKPIPWRTWPAAEEVQKD